MSKITKRNAFRNPVAKYARTFNKASVYVDRKKTAKLDIGKSKVQINSKLERQINIIGGTHRSRKITFLEQEGLRPTGSRIRETLFNWLDPYIEGARVLDLFAGSGILGFEASSRRAKQVILIENNNLTCHYLQKTIDELALANVSLQNDDAQNYLEHLPEEGFDIILLDPPFDLAIQEPILDLIIAKEGLKPKGLIYVETIKNQPLRYSHQYQLLKEKSSGNVKFYLLQLESFA